MTNTRSALETADAAAAQAGKALVLRTGVHRVTTSITLNSHIVVQPGAILKPSNGTVTTLNGSIEAPMRQFIDMSLGGVVVLQNVPQFLPEWWGLTGTSDDSETWRKMLISASYLPTRQVVLPRAGTTRLWNISLVNVHILGMGRTRRIAPATGAAVVGDPKSGTGYMVQIIGSTTIDGGVWDTDNITGITLIYWTGSRSWITGAQIKVAGANTIGVWAYITGGSLTPKITNTWVEGAKGSPSGVGIRYETPDGELNNVTIAYCSNGVELLRGSTVVSAVHVWDCTNYGMRLIGANYTRFIACYIEYNASWGIYAEGCSTMFMDEGTRIWANGHGIPGTGGMTIQGVGGSMAEDNRIGGLWDDNIGCALSLVSTDRTLGQMLIVSSIMKEAMRTSNAATVPVTTDGLVIDSASFGTEITVRSPENSTLGKVYSSPVLNKIVNDQNPLQSTVDLGQPRRIRKATPTVVGPTNAHTELFYLPTGIGHSYEFDGVMIIDGPVTNDFRFRIRTPGAVGMAGWFAATAATDPAATSATASNVSPGAVQNITTDGSTNIIVGTVGAGQKQMIAFRGYVSMGTAATTIALQAGIANVADSATATISYANMNIKRVA